MQCIIFTDSTRLAEKYNVSQRDVISLFEKNIQAFVDIEFFFLDANDYQEELKDRLWNNYKDILVDFMMGMGIQPSPILPVFIVGGDDVIPMPRIPNPLDFGEFLQSDFLYCFREDEPTMLEPENALCNIGRLPMENGRMPKSLRDDLQSYFNLLLMFLPTGIDIGNILMTSTQSWLPASNEMVRGLPVEEPRYIADATKDNMYTSPRLATDENVVLRQYKQDLEKADMLIFNLHGSDAPSYSSFYGEGAQGHNTPEAFNIDMLRHSNARIFNTVACFGGRYIGYNRTESMLLSSIFGGGVLLYAGSCVSALGRSGQVHVASQDILIPAGLSESFMKLYSLYLFRGITAGEAFLRAKCDYFNTCRSLDGDEGAMATILMFNLYGLPALRVNKNTDVTDEARGIKMAMPINRLKRKTYKLIYQKGEQKDTGLLNEVRGYVNRNLQHIRQVVEQELYSYWGLEPANLNMIEQVTDNNLPSGYRFTYSQKSRPVNLKSVANVDNLGKIKSVFHYK